MRILLINTNKERWPIPAAPIGLSLVASSLRKAGHEIRVIDRMFLFSQKEEQYFNVMRVTRTPKFGKFRIDQ